MSRKLPDAGIPFTIHQSGAAICIAMTVDRSGNRPLPLSFGDLLFSNEADAIAGRIESVDEVIRVMDDTWFYKISYRPEPGTSHGYFGTLRYAGKLEIGKNEKTGQADSSRLKALSATA